MNTYITELKAELKAQAITIRANKRKCKQAQRENRYIDAGCRQAGLVKQARDYRHKHIAYCLLLGTPYERIEQPNEGNEPDWTLIRQLQEQYVEAQAA